MKKAMSLLTVVVLFMMLITGCNKKSPTENTVSDTVKDIDGNVYQTVKIGNQVWMAENLKVTHYCDGTPINHVTDNSQWENLSTGAYCAFDNSESTADIYGYLYNWFAVTDVHNIAPSGWHVPTDAEWATLVNYLGGEEVAGGKMKTTGTTHWGSPNEGATNESGFSALPGGSRHGNGGFRLLGYYAYFWSSTEYGTYRAWSRVLGYSVSDVYRGDGGKQGGYSIRLIRD